MPGVPGWGEMVILNRMVREDLAEKRLPGHKSKGVREWGRADGCPGEMYPQ